MGRASIISRRHKGGSRYPFLWGVICLFVLAGCGETSFLGRQYKDFNAYYNTFYNAKTAFEKGVTALRESERSVDRTRYISIFLEPREGANDAAFETAIEKSADLLREHPNSKWVDDALLLIGKSYYYQANYIGAVQKFREVIALESERTREARFWLARTLVVSEQYSAATDVLQVASRTEVTGPWTARLELTRGELLARQEQWEEAVRALQRGLSGDVPDEPAARGAFLLGQVLETLGHAKGAEIAYRRVQEYTPSYALGFAARLSEIELQGAYGDASRALERLEDAEEDEKNYERRGGVAIVRARIYRSQGQYDQARAALRDVLYGEDPPSGVVKGRLHYDLATLYRSAYDDFSQAAVHFDTASARLERPRSSGPEESRPLPGAPVDAQEQADRYRNLAERSQEVARLDSLLRIGRLSDEEFEVFVEELRRKREAERSRQAQEAPSAARRLRRGGDALTAQRREASSAADTRTSGAGFLFHKDPTRVQQGKRRFRETWGDRARVDDWRRRNAIRAARTGARANQEPEREARPPSESDAGVPSAAGDTRLGLSNIPRDSSSLAEMESDRAVARYELANSIFLAANRPDSAATLYRQILQENEDHPVAKRARYALAEAYRAAGDSVAAEEAYRRLIRQHPETDLAMRARQRLGTGPSASTGDVTVRADSTYARAYDQWQQGAWQPALDSMLALAWQHPATDTAPRALLAAGSIYWKQSENDPGAVSPSVLRRHLSLLRGVTSSDSASTSPLFTAPDQRDRIGPMGERDSPGRERTAGSEDSPADDGDSTAPGDGAREPALMSGSESDTLGAPVLQDSTAVDSTARPTARVAGRDSSSPLVELLRYLRNQYPDSPYSQRAASMLDIIAEQRKSTGLDPSDRADSDRSQEKPAHTDSLARADRQGAGRDGNAVQESATPQSPLDTMAARGRKAGLQTDTLKRRDAPSEDGRPLSPPTPGEGPQRPGQGPSETDAASQWTLLVDTFSSSEAAEERREGLERAVRDEWRVTLHRTSDDEPEPYQLLVGRYATRESARKAKVRLAADISATPTIRQWPAGDSPER